MAAHLPHILRITKFNAISTFLSVLLPFHGKLGTEAKQQPASNIKYILGLNKLSAIFRNRFTDYQETERSNTTEPN